MKAWLLSIMLAHVPVDRAWQAPTHPETAVERVARYADIAADIADLTSANDSPLLGRMSRRDAAALMLAIAIGESGLAADADIGPCYRLGGYASRCDRGLAVGLWQVQVPRDEQAPYWADRRAALRLAMVRVRISLEQCRQWPEHLRLAAYGSGSCAKGHKGAAQRWRLYERIRRMPDPGVGAS